MWLTCLTLLKGWSERQGLDISDPYIYSEKVINGPSFQAIWNGWKENLAAGFYGITSNGVKRGGLYRLQDEGAPTQEMVIYRFVKVILSLGV